MKHFGSGFLTIVAFWFSLQFDRTAREICAAARTLDCTRTEQKDADPGEEEEENKVNSQR